MTKLKLTDLKVESFQTSKVIAGGKKTNKEVECTGYKCTGYTCPECKGTDTNILDCP